MRRFHLALWATASLLLVIFVSSSTEDFMGAPATRQTKIVRIALLPICNPGLSCDPALPSTIATSFFRSSFGVANFVREVSHEHTRIVGTTLPWLRAKKRVRNIEDLIAERDQLIALAHDQLEGRDVDVFVFYLKLGGGSADVFEVMRESGTREKVFAFLVNPSVYHKPESGKPASVIVPSTSWARAMLRGLGVDGANNTLNCEKQSRLTQCTVQKGKDPYSILGDMAFSVAPPAALTRSIRDRQSLKTIDADGSYRLAFDNRSPTTLAIALRTPLVLNESMQFDRIYVEQKRYSKFDRRLRSLQGKDLTATSRGRLEQHANGAFLYLGSSKPRAASTLLIDVNPKTSDQAYAGRSALLAEFADTALMPGQQFRVFETPIIIEVTDHTATSLTIKVAGLSQ